MGFIVDLYRRKLITAYYARVKRDPHALLHTRASRENPYPIYERMRAAGTVSRTAYGSWVATSHSACNTVLRDRRFGTQPEPGPSRMSFLDIDPPDHTRLRRVAQPAFSPRLIQSYRPRISAQIDALLDAATARGSFDLVPAFAAPLPIAVITDLLGVPDEDRAAFAEAGAVFGSAISGVRSLAHARRLQAADRDLDRLFTRLFEVKRADPGDDVISRVVASADVTPEEMRPLCTLLLFAGFETTVNLIGNAVNALLTHPGQWEDLCADPAGLAAAAVEETLRWDSPVQRTVRYAHDDVTVDGVAVRRGEWVNVILAAANRDPAVFPDAGVFDIHRTAGADHMAFSSGIHYCVGAPLARLEVTLAVQRLAERMPGLRRDGRVRYRPSALIRGLRSFPVANGVAVRRDRPALSA